MTREYWDFKSPMEDYRRIFEDLPPECPPDFLKAPEWAPVMVMPRFRTPSRRVEIRPIAPPDQPEWIRRHNEQARAEQPQWIRRHNEAVRRKAAAAAAAADDDGPE